jgi:putative redox protein
MSQVVVHGTAVGFTQEVVVGRHRLNADEPEAQGGADAGPSPYDYLLVALGT